MIADALARLGGWLAARPYRLTVLNALLLAAILTLIGSADLFRFIGGAAILLCTAVFLVRTMRRIERVRSGLHPYDVTLLLAPTAIAAVLAAGAVALVVANPPGSFAHALGVVLFTVEFALLALSASDAEGSAVVDAGRP